MGRLSNLLRSSASLLAIDSAIPELKAKADTTVTAKAGKRGQPFRRIIAYDRKGPTYTQVGEKHLAGESWPIMRTSFAHRFLHATKGWRAYAGGSAMRSPPVGNPPRKPTLPRFPFKGWRAHKAGGALGWRVIEEGQPA